MLWQLQYPASISWNPKQDVIVLYSVNIALVLSAEPLPCLTWTNVQ